MHHHTDRIVHTTTFVTPDVEYWLEREIAQWVHPMKDRSDDQMLLPRSYISLPTTTTTTIKLINKIDRNKQGLKRTLFNETRQYNIQMFNKMIFLK